MSRSVPFETFAGVTLTGTGPGATHDLEDVAAWHSGQLVFTDVVGDFSAGYVVVAIEVSLDGVTWFNTASNNTTTLYFNNVTGLPARYVRLNITAWPTSLTSVTATGWVASA
jgi:hypothetical protein